MSAKDLSIPLRAVPLHKALIHSSLIFLFESACWRRRSRRHLVGQKETNVQRNSDHLNAVHAWSPAALTPSSPRPSQAKPRPAISASEAPLSVWYQVGLVLKASTKFGLVPADVTGPTLLRLLIDKIMEPEVRSEAGSGSGNRSGPERTRVAGAGADSLKCPVGWGRVGCMELWTELSFETRK